MNSEPPVVKVPAAAPVIWQANAAARSARRPTRQPRD